MKRFKFLPVLLLSGMLAWTNSGCDEETTTPIDPGDPDVQAPTNLLAASGDNAVFLMWTLSTSETQSNFGNYSLTIFNQATGTSQKLSVAKGQSSIRVDGLINGTRYRFSIRSVTSKGKESPNLATIEWAPAVRQNTDIQGQPIKVYATTSNKNSAVDLFNASGKAEVIPQSGQEFKDRGDMYVYTPSSSTTYLEIKSPDQANNKGMVTKFSSASADMDNLDDHLLSALPSTSTFTEHTIRVNDGTYTKGKVYFGKLMRGNDEYFFRILIRKSGSTLIQGSGNDRFFELVASFQNTPNVPFAKK